MMLMMVVGCTSSSGSSTAGKADATVLDWDEAYSIVQKNGAYEEDYNGHWFIFTGQVFQIESNYCRMATKSYNGLPVNGIEVYLPTSELKKLTSGDVITVIGRMESIGHSPTLNDASIYEE